MAGLGYSVDSSSAQSINPTTTSGNSTAAQSFYFGGNPAVNTASQAISGLLSNKWAIVGAVAVALAFVYLKVRK